MRRIESPIILDSAQFLAEADSRAGTSASSHSLIHFDCHASGVEIFYRKMATIANASDQYIYAGEGLKIFTGHMQAELSERRRKPIIYRSGYCIAS